MGCMYIHEWIEQLAMVCDMEEDTDTLSCISSYSVEVRGSNYLQAQPFLKSRLTL